MDKYITGMSALNITGADWHLSGVIESDNWSVSGVDYADTTELFGLSGLQDCTNFFKYLGKKVEFVKRASGARAIADMLYHNIFILKHYPEHVIFYDYLLEEKDIEEFLGYFDILKKHAGKKEFNMLLRWKDAFIR